MAVQFKNNAASRLAVAISSSATSLSVTAGEGGKFPALAVGDWFPLTLVNASGALEIVQCTARAGDVLTITRAKEGTSAQAFAAGDRIELRLTEAAIAAAAQAAADAAVKKSGDTMTGPLVMPSSYSRIFAGIGSELGPGFANFYSPTNDGTTTYGAQIGISGGTTGVSGKATVVVTCGGMTVNAGFTAAAAVNAFSGRALLGDGAISLTAAAAGQNLVLSFVNSNFGMRGQLYTDPAGILRYSMAFVERFRVEAAGIVSTGQVYSGNGAAHLNESGNVVGPAWGGPLNTYLSNNYLQIGNLGASMAALGVGAIGSYAMLAIGGGGGIGPGDTVAGANTFYAAAGYTGRARGAPPGIWRIMGTVYNADGDSSDSITICQRVS